ELAVDEPDALLERLAIASRVTYRSLYGTIQSVEHGQQLLDEPLVGPRDQALLVARNPLAVVVEVGRHPLEVVQVGVALGLERRYLLLERELTLLGHEVLASSSTTSASSITSSSESVDSPLPDACACCAEACA